MCSFFASWLRNKLRLGFISNDKPYVYFVRDVKTGEMWFTGTVYQPNAAKDIMD